MALTPTADRPRSFDALFRSIADVQGWMSRAQACRLWDRALPLQPGDRIVEIGSYHGRSAIVLATAASEGVEVVAIDPHGGNDRGPLEWETGFDAGQADHEQFVANLRDAGVLHRIRHLRKASQDATGDVPGEVQLLYIDGAHRYRPARADIERWGAKVTTGGTMLIHDSFNSVGVMHAQLMCLFPSGKFRYIGRSGSMAEYRREDLNILDRVANAFRQALELPYFAWNVFIKALIVAKAKPLYTALGNDGRWPY
jgi:predicted O-methyltransferase YrrM